MSVVLGLSNATVDFSRSQFFRDLKTYQDTIATFALPALHERFEFLRQLGNVFLVRPEILKSYIMENYLGRIDASLLRPYLAQRSDWGQFEKGFNDAPGDIEETGVSSQMRGLRERFGVGRLSVMMKDLEGLRLSEGMPAMPSGFTGNFSITSRAFGGGA